MISGVVFAALNGLNGAKCYVNDFEQPDGSLPNWPAIRFQLVTKEPHPDICGTDDGTTDTTRVQIDFVAKTYGAAAALALAARIALMSVSPPCRYEGGFETKDSLTKTHRIIDDYSFHPSSVLGSP